jgi:hypothetical protein
MVPHARESPEVNGGQVNNVSICNSQTGVHGKLGLKSSDNGIPQKSNMRFRPRHAETVCDAPPEELVDEPFSSSGSSKRLDDPFSSNFVCRNKRSCRRLRQATPKFDELERGATHRACRQVKTGLRTTMGTGAAPLMKRSGNRERSSRAATANQLAPPARRPGPFFLAPRAGSAPGAQLRAIT